MKREVVVFLVLGSCVISFLEGPSALTSVMRAWNGPYPECASERSISREVEPLQVEEARNPVPMLWASHGSFGAQQQAPSTRPELIPAVYRASNSSDPASLPSLAEN